MRERCGPRLDCAWCGQTARFHYYWDRDDRSARHGPAYGKQLKAFCSVSCFRTYNA